MALRRGKKHEAAGDLTAEGRRVLVVNDDPNACELIVRVLHAAPQQWSVDRARDQVDMADRVNAGGVDVIVIDVVAGGLGGGLKLLDTIRGSHDRGTATLPVVLIAASPATAMFSWEAGTDALLVRPFHANELVEAVTAVLTRPEGERTSYRRRQLEAARSSGRGATT